MDDVISRQQAIDALCAACGKACDKSKFVYNAPQDEQVILCPEHYCLCTLPSAQPEPHWIPCSERLPKTTGEYLVTKREMYTHRLIIDIAMYFVNDGWHKADPVIAWMPKPEPYKGVTE